MENINQNKFSNDYINTNFSENKNKLDTLFTITSEAISSSILEKIINYTITEVQRRKTFNDIPKKCFKFMTNIIENTLKLEFLPYDTDDYLISKEDLNLQNTFGFNSHYQRANLSSSESIPSKISEKFENSFDKFSENNNDQNMNMSINNKISNDRNYFNNIENNYFCGIKKNYFYDNNSHGLNDWSFNIEPVYII